MIPEQGRHLIALAFAHHACIDIDAGELVSDGLMYQDGRDRAVYPA